MSLYLVFNAIVAFILLLLSFGKRVSFYKRWPSALSSIVITCVVFAGLEALAILRGDVHFNLERAGTRDLFGVPLDAIFFFLTVSYVSLFFYEAIRAHWPEHNVNMPPWLASLVGVAFVAVGLAYYYHPYTLTVFTSCGVIFLLSAAVVPNTLRSSWFWLGMASGFVLVTAADIALSFVPVISYTQSHIVGIEIHRTPIEDLPYAMVLVMSNLLLHIGLRARMDGNPRPVPPV